MTEQRRPSVSLGRDRLDSTEEDFQEWVDYVRRRISWKAKTLVDVLPAEENESQNDYYDFGAEPSWKLENMVVELWFRFVKQKWPNVWVPQLDETEPSPGFAPSLST